MVEHHRGSTEWCGGVSSRHHPKYLAALAVSPGRMMPKSSYVTVGRFRNQTRAEMRLYLEMTGAEIVMSPGHAIDLLAAPGEGLLPIEIDCVEGGLQIHPHKEFDPDWHVLFAGKLIPAGYPTVLA